MSPFSIKRRGIPDRAVDTVKRTGYEGTSHEHFLLAGKRGINPKDRCRGEPEPWIITRVSDYNDDPVSQLPAGPKPLFNKTRSNSPTLVFRTYRKWCKGNGRYACIFRFDRYRSKEDMTDNFVIVHGNKRESGNIIPVLPEGTDKPGFAVLAECLNIDIDNGGDIFRDFRSDKKRIHPVL